MSSNQNLTLDADYAQAIAPYASYVPPVPTDVESLRKQNDFMIDTIMSLFPCPAQNTVSETELPYKSADGTQLTLHRFTPQPNSSPPPAGSPCVLYLHGGGLISGSVPSFKKDIIRYAAETGITFFAPTYRLSPEAPFPKPLEDAYAALEFLRDNAKEQQIDPKRIAVFGISAGGGLAAGLALKARDNKFQPAIKKLVLIYPMLDDRTRAGEDDPLNEHLTWTNKKNELGWGAYLAGGGAKTVGSPDVSVYAAPGRAEDLSGLPPTYVDVGGLDLFKDEVNAFGGKLLAGKVDVEFHLYPGVPHAWEWLGHECPVTKKAVQNRVSTLRDL
ncbi:Alpha/Beta hydrolase protein [Triangularia verruculosa]|uniref:Alpha/Beta hydrolase protein n=1 Tax=Triangularia verruculosa TaxID=2587418 RepID=A0AAN6XJZ2_9PEZI|nr:Alpha/Beta hydrolase protein [Triangularia verruculosa]